MARKRRGRGEGSVVERPDGRWSGQVSLGYDAEGRRIRRTVYAPTKKEVLQKIGELQQSPLIGAPVKLERLTVEQHMQDWLAAKKAAVRATTFDSYRRIYKNHIGPIFGGLRLRSLDYRRINALYLQLEEKGLGKRTIAYVAFVLRSALEDAVRKGLISANPAKLAAKRTQTRKEARFLSQDELRGFLKAAEGARLEDGFILALNTGLRPGEWMGLSWDAVDWDGAKITVKQALKELNGKTWIGEVKTGAGRRTISLPPIAVEALKRQRRRQAEAQLVLQDAWHNEDHLVFTNTEGGLLRRTAVAARELRPIVKAAGLQGVSLHTLRHTHVAILIAQGVDPKTISRRLGHTNVGFTLQVYGHLLPGQDEKAADRVGEFFERLAVVRQ